MGECFVKVCKMLLLDLLIVAFLLNTQAEFVMDNSEDDNSLVTCVKGIINKYYEKGKEITYVDIESDDNEMLKMINAMSFYSLISRKQLNVKIRVLHQGYVIYAGNAEAFVKNFLYIKRESTWNPRVKFIIIIKILRKDELRDVFEQILHVHAMDVIVINGTNEADIYTYNPFENYACGKYFDRIIEYGQCSKPTVSDLYPNKFVTGLRNCTFSVAIPHIPPLTIFPNANKTKYRTNKGTEQFAFETISKLEKFNINYSYINFAETSSMIDEDMKSKGFFSLIETNQTDVLFGYTWLTSIRSKAFDNLYAHLAFTDTLTYCVKTSGNVPLWMNIYLEFNSIVWISLFVSFVVFSTLLVYLLRINDKISIVLKLWDTLFLHGYSIQCRSTVKCILLFWIWFSYLINTFYQSSLVSLTMHPSKMYQVSTEKDLIERNFKSCVSPSMIHFLSSEANMTFKQDIGNCQRIKDGIRTVSDNDNIFSIVPFSIYLFNKHKYLDEIGNSKVYHFSEPVIKLIYSIYLYKGFPMHKKLHKHSIYLRQSGLMDKHFNDLYYDTAKVHNRKFDVSFKARIVVPWNLMLIGCTFAMVAFILEILIKNNCLSVRYL